jgi:hypothetical protein
MGLDVSVFGPCCSCVQSALFVCSVCAACRRRRHWAYAAEVPSAFDDLMAWPGRWTRDKSGSWTPTNSSKGGGRRIEDSGVLLAFAAQWRSLACSMFLSFPISVSCCMRSWHTLLLRAVSAISLHSLSHTGVDQVQCGRESAVILHRLSSARGCA